MKGISIDRLRQALSYCPETGLLRWKLRTSSCVQIGNIAGWTDSDGYVMVRVDKVLMAAHRVIWAIVTGEWPREEIDHKDLLPSNNRWDNLREATKRQNGANKRVRRDSRSGVKGVHWHCQNDKWRARIKIGGKEINLGCFDSIDEAAEKYRNATLLYHGEFGRA